MSTGQIPPIVLTARDDSAPAFNSARGSLAALRNEAQAAAAGLGQSTIPLEKVGMSAKATAAAMRQVPAQLQDIIVSLQGGQAPMTVFLQQGSQLATSFGGAGAALKAVTSYALGLVNPFTVAAAAAGALGLAYYQGSKELDAYTKALVLTGNATGTTVSQLQDMARAMAEGNRTQAASAGALAEMAESSGLAADHLQRYTAAAMDWEKVTGTAINKTAQAFKSLQDDPLNATLRLNDGMNYLTVSIYEQIRSLEEQGKKTEAARVAQEAYASSLSGRASQVKQDLGYIEVGWNAVTDAAKKAWDAMLGVGRASTKADRIAEIDRELADLAKRAGSGFGTNEGGAAFGRPSAQATAAVQARIQALQAMKAEIMGVMEAERQKAAQDAKNAQNAKTLAAWDQQGLQYLSKRQKMERELAAETVLGQELINAGLIKEADLRARLDAIREKYTDKAAASKEESKAARQLAQDMSLLAESAGLTSTFYKEWDQLIDLFKRGKMNLDQLTEAQGRLLSKQPAIRAETEAQTRKQDELNKAREKFLNDQTKYLQGMDQESRAQAEKNEAIKEEIARMGLSTRELGSHEQARIAITLAKKEEQLATLELMGATAQETQALRDQIELLRERQGLVGQRAEKSAHLEEVKQLETDYRRIVEQYEQGLMNAAIQGGKSLKEYITGMLRATAFRIVLQPVMSPLANVLAGLTGQGGSGVLGAASNGMSLANMFSAANWFGSGSLLSGLGTAYGNASLGASLGLTSAEAYAAAQAASVAGGGSIYGSSLGAAAGSGSFGGLGSGLSAGATAAGVLALPILAGVIAGYLDNGDRTSGAAYATSGGNDALARVLAGSTRYNELTGDLPDREALRAALRGYGAGEQYLSGNDRTLHQMLLLAQDEARMNREGGANMNWSQWSQNMTSADFYRGAGYASPSDLGWWDVENRYMGSTSGELVSFSRQLSESIVGSLRGVSSMLGRDVDYRVASGIGVNPDDRNPVWGGLQIWENDQSTLNWGMREFQSRGEYLRATFSDTLSAFESMNLPAWADRQVADARAALDKLDTGDKLGEQAGSLFDTTRTSLTQMYAAIERLTSIIPEFAGASQDAVFNIQSAMGGLDALTGSYGSYVQNYYSAEERANYVRAGINDSLAQYGYTVDGNTTRDDFKAWVDALTGKLDVEEAQKAWAALMQVESAFASITPASEAAAIALANSAEAAKAAAQAIGTSFDSVLVDGMLGRITQADLGGQMADAVIGGVYNAVAGGFANKVTTLMTDTVVTPLITAAMTGSSLSEAVSKAAINNMVAQAQAAAQALNQVFNDPAFLAAIGDIRSAIGSISAVMPTTPYYSSYASQQQMAAQATSAATSAKTAADALKASQDAAYAALQRSIGAEKQRLQTALEASREIERETKSVFDYLHGQVRDLYGTVDSTAAMQAEQGRALIDQALGTFRGTGSLPQEEELREAVEAVRAQLNGRNYATSFEQNYDRLVLAGQLAELRGGAESQLTEAERQVQLMEQQVSQLDSSLETAKKQLDALHGIDTSVLSVAAALEKWNALTGKTPSKTTSASYTIYPELRPIGSYDVGTSYVPYDQIARVHQGERIFTADDNAVVIDILRRGAGQDALVAEIKSLRDDARVQAGEVVRLQARVTKLLERWDGQGLPAEREASQA